jgi:hypothetical protein
MRECSPGLCSRPSVLPSLGHWLSRRGDEEEKPLEVIHQITAVQNSCNPAQGSLD